MMIDDQKSTKTPEFLHGKEAVRPVLISVSHLIFGGVTYLATRVVADSTLPPLQQHKRHGSYDYDLYNMISLQGRRRRTRRVQEEDSEAVNTNDDTTAANGSSSTATEPLEPRLLNTLTEHKTWWDARGGEAFDRDNGSNKLDVYTDRLTGDRIAFCHLISMNAFSRTAGGNTTYSDVAYESAIATMLAVQHLNTGDGSIIPELEGLPERCPIRFSIQYVDTEFDVGTALNHAIALTHPRINVTDDLGDEEFAYKNHLPPCAFLGASQSAVSGPTSIITGLNDFVQLSGESTSSDLDDRNQYPRFARTVPSDAGTAEALIQFLHEELKLEHLAVINVNDSFGNAYARNIRDAARLHATGMEILQISVDHDKDYVIAAEELKRAVGTLKRSDFAYSIVVFGNMESHDALMMEAEHQGLAGSGQYNFMFTDGFNINQLTTRVFNLGSPLHRAYSGTGIIRASGGIHGESRFDTLTEKHENIVRSAPDVKYAASLLPGDTPALITDQKFLHPVRFHSTSYNFDAAILIGLAACDAINRDLVLTGRSLYNQLFGSSFGGISGTVALDPETGSRIANSTYFNIWNLVDVEVENALANSTERKIKFESTATHLFSRGHWNMKQPFTFGDGTMNPPKSLIAPNVERNHMHTATRAVILIFCAVAIVSAIGCAVWTWSHRNERIVRASQPFFLGLLCLGSVVFASSIIPISFDAGNLSLIGLERTCTAQVWLVNLGATIIFSALFSKTHRINKIMNHAQQFKRIKVTVRDTLRPMGIIFSCKFVSMPS
jgi:Receptor family ligand binding region/7 transmembrane sweet-taste receptor of 3 GCPR